MKKALVLCGGGSLGAYEVGAVKYLYEIGESFDIITGTSIGALNSALLASHDFAEVERIWEEATVDKVIRYGFSLNKELLNLSDWHSKWPRLRALVKSFLRHGGADISPFKNWLHEVVDPKAVVNSPKTVGVVATRFPSMKEADIVLNHCKEEDVIPYLLASSACFPIFPIYKHGKTRYIDGGYTNNLPIDLAFSLGADTAVAIMLHAIPEIPQHYELLSLPIVKAIIPTHDTGTIMDFSRERMVANKKLGYLDAAKRFGKYYGHLYAFEKDPKQEEIARNFQTYLAKDTLEGYFKIEKILTYRPFPLVLPIDLIVRPLEIIADELGLDYLRPWRIEEMVDTIHDILHQKEYVEAGRAFAAKKTHTLGMKNKEIPAFLAYCVETIEHHKTPLPIRKTSQVDPLAGVLYSLARYVYALRYSH